MKTNSTTEREQCERSSERETNGVNVVSMRDYLAKKASNSMKQVFKDSMDNDQVMQRYKIKQPTLEERTERIKQSVDRINKLLKEIKETR